ncbi:hypothetical protein R3W88_014688 [Solanum pinnatisectum]|uniref:Uncharacterized protein n=1 Tax=Solanum pinnatisectum TaxID=50273 RepID=A0AAV9KSD5_9SOLN|nr:hypothetical protein R3W88_014688 [Solanum pinnatisectum]
MNRLRNMSYDGEWKLPRYTIHRMNRSWSKLSSDHLMSFDSLIQIGKELEYGIQSGRNIDAETPLQVLKSLLDERNKDASTSIPLKRSNHNTKQVHAIFDSCYMCFKPHNPRVSQLKVRKPRTLLLNGNFD